MDNRREELNKIRSYTNEIDKDLTMILQTLQWDRKHILEHQTMASCLYDPNHKVLIDKAEEHQQKCLLQHNGYSRNEKLLPDPLDTDASTLIKFNKNDIKAIIDNASRSDPMFKRGIGSGELEPLTLDRLQCAYSSDERRVIHDAVVSAAPACHDLTDLALLSAGDADEAPKTKTRMEILAELRDMRRRRTKYRVAAKSRNYSDVLRDVIKTQMEHYNGTQDGTTDVIVNTNTDKQNDDTYRSDHNHKDEEFSKHDDGGRVGRDREISNNDSKKRGSANTDHMNKNNYREIKSSRRDDDRYRDRSRATRHDHDTQRDRHKDIREKHRHRERSSESNDNKYDRKLGQNRLKEDYDKNSKRHHRDRSKEKRRSKDRYSERYRDLEKERSRQLITEIKREIEPADNEDVVSGPDRTYPRSSTEIKQEKNSNVCKAEKDHHEKESDKRNKNRDADVDSLKSSEIKYNHRKEDYIRDKEKYYDDKRQSSIRAERNKRKDRYRERSREREAKKSRTEDKHRIYNEIYSELNNKRIKES